MPDTHIHVHAGGALGHLPHQVVASPSNPRTVHVTKASPSPAYYKATPDVSPVSNDGSIAPGASQTFTARVFLCGDGSAAPETNAPTGTVVLVFP